MSKVSLATATVIALFAAQSFAASPAPAAGASTTHPVKKELVKKQKDEKEAGKDAVKN